LSRIKAIFLVKSNDQGVFHGLKTLILLADGSVRALEMTKISIIPL